MCGIEGGVAPFQGAGGGNETPGHRPDGLSPGLGSGGPLGRDAGFGVA